MLEVLVLQSVVIGGSFHDFFAVGSKDVRQSPRLLMQGDEMISSYQTGSYKKLSGRGPAEKNGNLASIELPS